ncbi:hypothetical protein T440DRAFT_467193 [Plenodomus tracheiphilus IPT5]|uniref:Uncharacterized protein n=1 Tax=Plenodomus tracheiphilus IPT5 TaxID=1408161 RepID=A0A6A7B8R0_9PLEO|nr:hypothetical protein T440DRAFT_467193 [Plenodomus tracheiphilus IPT5]
MKFRTVTLHFFHNTQKDTCNFRNSSSALTFTTSSVPIKNHCFDGKCFSRICQ